MTEQLVDLHCHILPGIDDGAKDLDISMQLLQQELQDGAVGVCFTPHFHYERTTVEQFDQNRHAAFLSVKRAAQRQKLRLAMKCGAEVYYTPALPSLDLKRLAFYGSNYILIEFPTTYHPAGIEETLFAVEQKGYTPILAHVERYPFVSENPTLLYNWVMGGALAQMNASSLLRRGHTAELLQKYMSWNLIHLICSDAHSPDHRPANLKAGLDTLPDAVSKSLQENAIEVYLGNPLRSAAEPIEPRYRFGRWV